MCRGVRHAETRHSRHTPRKEPILCVGVYWHMAYRHCFGRHGQHMPAVPIGMVILVFKTFMDF